ncbi:PR-1-like protein, partial [Aureobasidium melanogenum]
MRTTTLITGAALAATAFAGPIFKRDLEIDTVYDVAYETVYVTETEGVTIPVTVSAEQPAPAATTEAAVTSQYYGHRHSWSAPAAESSAASVTVVTSEAPAVTVVSSATSAPAAASSSADPKAAIPAQGYTSAWTSSWASTWVVTPSAESTTAVATSAAPAATTEMFHPASSSQVKRATSTIKTTSTVKISSSTKKTTVSSKATSTSKKSSSSSQKATSTSKKSSSSSKVSTTLKGTPISTKASTTSQKTSSTKKVSSLSPSTVERVATVPASRKACKRESSVASPISYPKSSSSLIKPSSSLKPTSSFKTSSTSVKTTPTSARSTPTSKSSSSQPKSSSKSSSSLRKSSSSTLTSNAKTIVQASSTVAAPSGKATTYQEIVLAHHNVHRANHSACNLEWDSQLAATAQQIAATCVYAHSMDVNGGGYGQNIAAGVEANNVSAVITELFYNGEVGYYNNLYGQANPDMTNFEKWGHFSQLVWKGTTKVGCATQYCSGGLANVGQYVAPYFTVCNYGAPGNYAGEYADNVGASLNQPTQNWSYDLVELVGYAEAHGLRLPRNNLQGPNSTVDNDSINKRMPLSSRLGLFAFSSIASSSRPRPAVRLSAVRAMSTASSKGGFVSLSNRCNESKSPYVRSHADNPTAWQLWSPETLELSKRTNRLLFVSIGYSACHWCHVMAHESFMNDRIAQLLNEHFIPVKIDREERPDVDKVYMDFLQATTGGGGWPLNVFVTPDLQPLFGGTYWPGPKSERARHGGGGFEAILTKVASAWKEQESRCRESAANITDQLKQFAQEGTLSGRRSGEGAEESDDVLELELLEEAYDHYNSRYDEQYGGFGGAPKFPTPSHLSFLLRLGEWDGIVKDVIGDDAVQNAQKMVSKTLENMAKGGIKDQVGHGFARYSVTKDWSLPHFEKMLYDNAQLLPLYLDAWLITKNPLFLETVHDIATYLTSPPIQSPTGGFHASEDADSAPSASEKEHKEGAFYVWSHSEFYKALGDEKLAEMLAKYWNVKPNGNVSSKHDIQGELKGLNTLCVTSSLTELAQQFGLSEQDAAKAVQTGRQRLSGWRDQHRPRPLLDDKIVVSWNGLAIGGLARTASALQQSDSKASRKYLEAAISA